MSIVGKVQSLWRYPVKSVRGEELEQAFAGCPGVYGDGLFAFKSLASLAAVARTATARGILLIELRA
jgi:MOSC domain-containing protein